MLFSDDGMYIHLTAQLDACGDVGMLTHRIQGLFGFVLFFFSHRNIAKKMMFRPCPRYASFHAETFLQQSCKGPFNCISL